MGSAKRRKELGVYPERTSDREKLLKGIDRQIQFILRSIDIIQKRGIKNPVRIQITNDIPGSSVEESIGLSQDQIKELTEWLNSNASRIGNFSVSVLTQEDCPEGGLLYLLPDWTQLLTVIFDNTGRGE